MGANFYTEQHDTLTEWPLNMTSHLTRRASQRGLSTEQILDAMSYGKMFQKQGLTYYVVGQRFLPDNFPHRKAEKLNKMVVVVSNDNGEVITCYKSENGFKHIRHKSKKFYS